MTNSSLLIPWESGSRLKLPMVKVHIQSVASIDNLHLDGGPSAVFCPQVGRRTCRAVFRPACRRRGVCCVQGSEWPDMVKGGYYSVGGNDTTNTTRVNQVKVLTAACPAAARWRHCGVWRLCSASPGTSVWRARSTRVHRAPLARPRA